jgi:hypothetical protein
MTTSTENNQTTTHVDGALAQVLYGTLSNGSTTTKRQFISNFQPFLLNHIPYAQVEPKDLQTGLIDWDGKAADGMGEHRPILVWYFGGLPYPITKAARIDYTYVRTWDGTNANASASILLGFQSEHKTHQLKRAPRANITVKDGAFVGQLNQALTALRDIMPADVISGSGSFTNLDDFVYTHIGKAVPAGVASVRAAQGQPAGYPRTKPLTIEFDGPARDSDSHHIFAYTLDTLFNDRDKFNQILWWHFGGNQQRITKAMRIPLDDSEDGPSLFVGFTGPGGYP